MATKYSFDLEQQKGKSIAYYHSDRRCPYLMVELEKESLCGLPCMENLPFWYTVCSSIYSRKIQVWLWGGGNVI